MVKRPLGLLAAVALVLTASCCADQKAQAEAAIAACREGTCPGAGPGQGPRAYCLSSMPR